MPPSSRIPPLLQPAVRLPHDDSILLLTSTLGASANWLIIRFLCDALNPGTQNGGGGEEQGASVLLVSWMREYEFWRTEARKGGGLDLEKLRREGRFGFVDGLGSLFLPALEQDKIAGKGQQGVANATAVDRQVLRAPLSSAVSGSSGRVIPTRSPPIVPVASATTSRNSAYASTTTAASPTQALKTDTTSGLYTLSSPSLAHLKSTITSALSNINANSTKNTNPKTFIILDNPDILLATTPTISLTSLTSLFLTLHALPTISHLLIHMQSDSALLSPSIPPQPLEVVQHNFLVKVAHMSRRVLGLRVLDTGVARDVSGVLRVTQSERSWMDLGITEEAGEGKKVGDGLNVELLYKVGGDGNVKVFERGAGGDS